MAGTGAVVSHEGDPPVPRAHLSGGGLGGVVQQRPPAQCLAAGHLVGQRLGQQRRHGGPVLADRGLRVAQGGTAGRGQLDRPVEHLQRVPLDVGMVEVALLDSPQGLELGQHDGQGADLARPVRGPPGGSCWRGSCAARRRPAHPRSPARPARAVAGERERLLVGLEAELAGDPHEAQDAQRVQREGIRLRRPAGGPPRSA